MSTITNNIILWEYDKPLSLNNKLLNYTSGLWHYYLSPAKDGIITVTDDRSVTGFYRYNNATVYNVQSLAVDGEQYSRVYSYADLVQTNKSFYYDLDTSLFIVHFDSFNPPIIYTDIVGGVTVGYALGAIPDNKYYFNDLYYEPRVKKVFNIKKSKDPLFYGNLKYTTGSVSCINEDGHFDDWRERNIYNQATRFLIGQGGAAYSAYTKFFSGLIEDDSQTWTEFTVKLTDPRKGLTRPIATNLLTRALYPTLLENNIDKPKPVKYGLQKNSPCMCLNETASGGRHTFLLCDSQFNAPSACTAIYLDGVAGSLLSGASFNYAAGTFTLSASASVTKDGSTMTVADNLDNITADFSASDIINGVDIIKDLMLNYDNKTYNSTFWDTSEVAAAQLLARDTSVSVDDNKKLKDVIQQVCVDIDAIFFNKNDGRYSIRLYNPSRTISITIQQDEWLDEPDISNNSSEFLSSVIIKYSRDIANDDYLQYENKDYEYDVFSTYRAYKNTEIETNLTTLADAILKSESVMALSKNVKDVVTRSIAFDTSLEIMDFVMCDPKSRMYDKYGNAITPSPGKWEILGIEYDVNKLRTKLTLRQL